MSVIELRLNSSLQEDPEGSILLRREGERLNAWQLIDGERYHLNPFSFGLPFAMRSLPQADFSALDNFLRKGRRKPEEFFSAFPRSSQIEIMEFYLKDEHGIKLSFAKRDTFCELFEQLYPVYWRYAITSHSCILYDGFYGRGPSEAYLPYQSSATYSELIEGVFGEVRKDTLREGRNIDAMGLSLAYIFRGILPLDVIVHELATQEGHFADFPLTLEPYKNLLRLSPAIRRRLFVDLIVDFKLDAQIVSDALDLLSVIPEAKLHRLKGTVSWNQLHRRLMTYCEAVEGGEVIAVPSELNLLADPLLGISFRPLQTANDFVTLGDWLDICIGKAGYFMRAVRGESFCLVGLKDEKPYAALEVKFLDGRWSVRQLRRAHNEQLEDQKAAIELIEERLNP